jgi:hypothetical protein
MLFYKKFFMPSFNSIKYTFLKLIIPSFLCIAGCEYSPDDVYFENIPYKEPESLTITINYDTDTILLLNPTYVNFNLDNRNLIIYSFTVILNDDKVIYSSRAYNGTFYLNPNSISSGTHKLTITATTSSGTGALSDVLNKDVQTFKLDKTLLVDYYPPDPVQITRLEIVDGTLKLEWEKYQRPNFTNYRIEIYDVSQEGSPRQVNDRIKIEKQDSTSLLHKAFLGGKFRYQVFVFAQNVHREVGSNYKYFELEYPPLQLETTLDSITVTWPKCKLNNSFGRYELHKAYSHSGSLLHTSTDINDTVFVFRDVGLGSVIAFDWKIFAANNNGSVANYSLYSQTILGEFFKNYTSFQPLVDNSALIMDQYSNSVYKYDLESNALLNKIDLPLIKIPRLNNYHTVYHSSFNSDYLCFSDGNNIFIHNNRDFKHIKTLATPSHDLITQIPFVCSTIKLSNNNIMAFVMEFDTYQSIGLKKYVYLYNINKGEYIDTLVFDDGNFSMPYIALSSEGGFLYYNIYDQKRIYKVAEHNTSLIGTITGNNFNIFNPLNDSELMILDRQSNEILRLNADDLTEISRFPVEPRTYSFYVDPVKGNIGAMAEPNSTYFFVYNLSNGEQLFKSYASSDGAYTMRFVNNTVYFSQFKIKVL